MHLLGACARSRPSLFPWYAHFNQVTGGMHAARVWAGLHLFEWTLKIPLPLPAWPTRRRTSRHSLRTGKRNREQALFPALTTVIHKAETLNDSAISQPWEGNRREMPSDHCDGIWPPKQPTLRLPYLRTSRQGETVNIHCLGRFQLVVFYVQLKVC